MTRKNAIVRQYFTDKVTMVRLETAEMNGVQDLVVFQEKDGNEMIFTKFDFDNIVRVFNDVPVVKPTNEVAQPER